MGRDLIAALDDQRRAGFQSTRPVWGATAAARDYRDFVDISIHAPRVGRDELLVVEHPDAVGISIHAPRVGRDDCAGRRRRSAVRFQSTRPVWGATGSVLCAFWCGYISIHAPRVGRDHLPLRRCCPGSYFNPRAPCGARPARCWHTGRLTQFQSTRPVWGATADGDARDRHRRISIHAPRVGRDTGSRDCRAAQKNFNPRAPCGARRSHTRSASLLHRAFQSTRPVWGATTRSGRSLPL